MDPLHLCIALGPVCVYLLVLGFLNVSKRPFLTTGGRDTLALALAISGLMIAGPLELFLPESAAANFGAFVWIPMVILYCLAAMLVSMMGRPRLVIYNISEDQLRPLLGQVVNQLDGDARWAGDSAVLPNLGIQFHIDPSTAMRNIQLTSSGNRQNLNGWKQLEQNLHLSIDQTDVGPNPRGFSLLFFGVVLSAVIAYSMVVDRPAVAQALIEMLRL